jgi:hypothetical protein
MISRQGAITQSFKELLIQLTKKYSDDRENKPLDLGIKAP